MSGLTPVTVSWTTPYLPTLVYSRRHISSHDLSPSALNVDLFPHRQLYRKAKGRSFHARDGGGEVVVAAAHAPSNTTKKEISRPASKGHTSCKDLSGAFFQGADFLGLKVGKYGQQGAQRIKTEGHRKAVSASLGTPC